MFLVDFYRELWNYIGRLFLRLFKVVCVRFKVEVWLLGKVRSDVENGNGNSIRLSVRWCACETAILRKVISSCENHLSSSSVFPWIKEVWSSESLSNLSAYRWSLSLSFSVTEGVSADMLCKAAAFLSWELYLHLWGFACWDWAVGSPTRIHPNRVRDVTCFWSWIHVICSWSCASGQLRPIKMIVGQLFRP